MSVIHDHLGKVLGLGPAPSAVRTAARADAYRQIFSDPTMPPKRHETEIAAYLFDRKYHVDSIYAVIEYALMNGTVECCGDLIFDARDRAAVEAMLPDAPAGEWDRFPGRVELVESGYEV